MLGQYTISHWFTTWFNPINGKYTNILSSPLPNAGIQVFTTPGDNGTGTNDWLLLLDAK